MESCGEENYSFYVNYICISDNEAIWTSAAIGLVVISIILSVNFIMKIAKKVNKLKQPNPYCMHIETYNVLTLYILYAVVIMLVSSIVA